MADEPSDAPDTAEDRKTPVERPVSPPEAFSGGGINVSSESPSIMNLVSAAAGLGLAGYVIGVALNGNLGALWTQLKKEEPYLEFAFAIVIVWALAKYGPTSEITDGLVIAAVVAVALKMAGRLNLQPALGNFASGQASIQQTVSSIFSQGSLTHAG